MILSAIRYLQLHAFQLLLKIVHLVLQLDPLQWFVYTSSRFFDWHSMVL